VYILYIWVGGGPSRLIIRSIGTFHCLTDTYVRTYVHRSVIVGSLVHVLQWYTFIHRRINKASKAVLYKCITQSTLHKIEVEGLFMLVSSGDTYIHAYSLDSYSLMFFMSRCNNENSYLLIVWFLHDLRDVCYIAWNFSPWTRAAT